MSSFTQSQHTEMRTDWIDDVSTTFHLYDDHVEEKLGYNPMIRDLIQTHGTNITVLDYGCGPGKVSRRLIRAKIAKVEAVDTSDDMIRQVNQTPASGPITFRKINTGELPYADDSFDAAISTFVLLCIPSGDDCEKIIRDIYRTLKPGGTFYILDINPKHVGVQFSTSRCGEPGVVYHDGDALPDYLKIPGKEDLKVVSTYWSKERHESILHLAGFTVQTFEYKSEHIPESERQGLGVNEALYAPFLIFKATKPV